MELAPGLGPWLALALIALSFVTSLITVAGFAGTTVGSRMLAHVPENVFRLAFRILLSVVALGLIRQAVS